jgi:glycosyltransferase involved in cell wall biosynthesis
MIPKKNFAGLIRAYALFRAQFPTASWQLVIIGDGPEMEGLRNLVIELGLVGLVRLPGYKSAEEIARAMALCRVFVMPSRSEEQWGLVMNEAMACGVPVVGSSICGATPELIVEGETGFAFDPKDEPALGRLLARCFSEEERLVAMGRAAQRQVDKCALRVFAESIFRSAEIALGGARTRSKFGI